MTNDQKEASTTPVQTSPKEDTQGLEQLPKVKEAVHAMADQLVKTLAQTPPPKGSSPDDNESRDMISAAANNPVEATKTVEQRLAQNSTTIEMAASYYALQLLEKDKSPLGSLSTDNKTGLKSDPETALRLETMAAGITELAAQAYSNGEDKSDLAREAFKVTEGIGRIPSAKAFEKAEAAQKKFAETLKGSLMTNPDTIELIRELPLAEQAAKKKQTGQQH